MTKQEDAWSGDFGKAYNERNDYSFEGLNDFYKDQYGVSRQEMNEKFLGDLSKDIKILEVGCNFGGQLVQLQKMGFKNLYGVELQWDAIKRARERADGINIIQGSGFDLPLRDDYFDLVFTSGVLIHISPDNISQIMSEMVRVSKKYIWGFEYYDNEYKEIPYRGSSNLMWKGPFADVFIKNNPVLKKIKEQIYPYTKEDLKDVMYLLEKNG